MGSPLAHTESGETWPEIPNLSYCLRALILVKIGEDLSSAGMKLTNRPLNIHREQRTPYTISESIFRTSDFKMMPDHKLMEKK